jgi:hypothetical protein
MRLPTNNATDQLRQLIRVRGVCYEVTRQTGVENIGMGETRQTTDTVYVDALLFAPTSDNSMTEFGDRLTGDLNGLALPDADVQVGDEYDHNGVTYEVTTVDSRPSDSNVELQRFALDKVTGNR